MGLWIGLALTAAGWLATRAAARAWSFRRPLGTLLDATAPMMAFGVALAATARPVFAGVVSFAMFGGFAFADLVKRLILRETVLFTDMSEFRELIRHPHLYLPFAGTGRVLAGFAAAVAGFVALLVFEPPAWPWSPIPGLIALALVALFIWSLYLPLLQPGTGIRVGDP